MTGTLTSASCAPRSFDRAQIRRYGPLTSEGHERIPVFRAGLTSNTTLRTLNRMICEFNGHPRTSRASAAQLAGRAAGAGVPLVQGPSPLLGLVLVGDYGAAGAYESRLELARPRPPATTQGKPPRGTKPGEPPATSQVK